MNIIGVIGGSGLYEMPGLRVIESRHVATPFGDPSAPYTIGEAEGVKVAFLPRHGVSHDIPPHKINYRANLRGFKELGVKRIISVNATGGINPGLVPGDLVLVDQVLDFTMGSREGTYFDHGDVAHVDFTEPYCPELREVVLSAAKATGTAVNNLGTYACVNGPRLESRAEIKFLANAGADLVGMTAMPEAALARELEICFASISVVTNRAAGLSGQKLTTTEVIETMSKANDRIKTLLRNSFARVPQTRNCPCKDALKGSGVNGK